MDLRQLRGMELAETRTIRKRDGWWWVQAPDVLGVLGITRIAASSQVPFKVEREYFIPSGGRLDLVLTLGESVMVVIEVKKYSAETADTAKQKGYFEWMRLTRFPQKVPLLLTTDAEEERYEGFSTILWADLCIRLRCLLPALSGGIGLVKAAMFVAFIRRWRRIFSTS